MMSTMQPFATGYQKEEAFVDQTTSIKTDQFSQAYDVEYVQSELALTHQFNFCGLCLSERPGYHAPTCLSQQAATDELEAQEFLTVNVFKHMPPRLDGCPLEDSQCSACQLALSASSSFWLINICEKDLGTPGSVTTIETAAAPETIP